MEINGKVHCFFEQSGTFKREFIKLGIPAEDYDIQNNYGETDHVIDLFGEICSAYEGGGSIFDKITKDDLIMAFFPCIYFCNIAELNQRIGPIGLRNKDLHKLRVWQLEQSMNRQKYYEYALKMTDIVECRGLRMVVENPWHVTNYTHLWWFNKPSIIDYDRTRRGDYFIKPTAYWFVGCNPTHGETISNCKESDRIHLTNGTSGNKWKHKDVKLARPSHARGTCSEERSIMSPVYARNFICDFILGKPCSDGCKPQQQDLFDM